MVVSGDPVFGAEEAIAKTPGLTPRGLLSSGRAVEARPLLSISVVWPRTPESEYRLRNEFDGYAFSKRGTVGVPFVCMSCFGEPVVRGGLPSCIKRSRFCGTFQIAVRRKQFALPTFEGGGTRWIPAASSKEPSARRGICCRSRGRRGDHAMRQSTKSAHCFGHAVSIRRFPNAATRCCRLRSGRRKWPLPIL